MPRRFSFEDFLEECPARIRIQYQAIRRLMQRLLPRAKEEIKYGTPFYTYHGMFLYFSFHKKKHWVVGFCQGSRMEDEGNRLKAEAGQQHVRHWVLTEAEPLDEDLFAAYLLEAEQVQLKFVPFSGKGR